jgi:hypothetical protein
MARRLTQQERAVRAARAVERDLDRIQRRVARDVLRALEEARRDVIDALARQPAAWRQVQLNEVLRETDRALGIFRDTVDRAARGGAVDMARANVDLVLDVLKAPGVELSAQVALAPADIVAAYGTLPELVTAISADTRAEVARILRRVVLAQESPHAAMRHLGSVTGKGTFRTAFLRGEAIVRTEMRRIGQTASQAQMQQADRALRAERRPPLRKQWLATRDARTRPAHAKADGQVVLVDESFYVGGEWLRFPGDPYAKGANTINCRCASIPYRAEWL